MLKIVIFLAMYIEFFLAEYLALTSLAVWHLLCVKTFFSNTRHDKFPSILIYNTGLLGFLKLSVTVSLRRL